MVRKHCPGYRFFLFSVIFSKGLFFRIMWQRLKSIAGKTDKKKSGEEEK